ncbi:hypothetical protein FB446DRAFT_744402 [Lentinula raphanica]|nr:hypothetical protein FB446DRAFT_744402 [Lentinula raphanica]
MSSSSRRPKSPTRVQLSSRLAYETKVPKFLQRLKNQVEGKTDPSYDDDDDTGYQDSRYRDAGYERGRDEFGRDVGRDEYEDRDEFGRERRAPDGGYNNDEFEYINDGSGRPPIPRRPRSRSPRDRPPIPSRPDDDPGSADEDSDDEKPQVVVLKAGKHLTEREAENERRKERGLPPLPDPENHNPSSSDSPKAKSQSTKQKESKSLSFSTKSSSSNQASSNFNALKRKVLGGGALDDGEEDGEVGKGLTKKKKKTTEKSSKKKEKKTLLSFGDDA